MRCVAIDIVGVALSWRALGEQIRHSKMQSRGDTVTRDTVKLVTLPPLV